MSFGKLLIIPVIRSKSNWASLSKPINPPPISLCSRVQTLPHTRPPLPSSARLGVALETYGPCGGAIQYLYALEGEVRRVGSSIPRDIYAFYLQHGLTARAKRFRERARKLLSYDIDYFFDMLDKNPSIYAD